MEIRECGLNEEDFVGECLGSYGFLVVVIVWQIFGQGNVCLKLNVEVYLQF